MKAAIAAGLLAAAGLVYPQDPVAEIMNGNRGVRTVLTGNLIDLDCYAEHGGFGPEHAKCSRFCAGRGLPAALLARDGKVYLIQGRRHQPMTQVNRSLRPLMENTIVVHGELLARGEVKVLVVDKAERAKEQTPWPEIRALYEKGRGADNR
jgi:hypothetical protein